MRKIKITYVVTNCRKTGPINQTLNIIKYMDRDIYEPSLITLWPEPIGNSLLEEYKKLGINIYYCDLSRISSIILGSSKVRANLDKIHPNIVHGIGMPPYRMTLSYKNAIHFLTIRNYCYEDYPDQYAKGIGTVMALMDISLIKKRLKQGNPFITCSESLSKIYLKEEKINLPFIRNGVDISKYKRKEISEVNELRRELGIPIDKIVFIYSGMFVDRKNQSELLEAFAKIDQGQELELVLLGDGKDKPLLKERYSNYKNILFIGNVTNVEDYLRSSDVYISTSKSEGLPNGVLEAMACGLPVILSNIEQHKEVLDAGDNCGYSYKLGNIDDLTQKISAIAHDDLAALGENSYNNVINNFTAKGMSEQYQNLYYKLVVSCQFDLC